jgi:hypothetical protein
MEEKEVEVKIIYSTYTPAVKECIKRYREKNKEKNQSTDSPSASKLIHQF